MLTLKSKFSEYVDLVIKNGACEEAINNHKAIVEKSPEITIGDVYSQFEKDPDLDQGWCRWMLMTLGKELDDKIRTIIINKLKEPMDAVHILLQCEYLTTTEDNLLKAKFPTGTLPTVDKELATGLVVWAKDRVTP